MTWQAGIRGPDPPRRGPLERRIAPQRAQGAQRQWNGIRVGTVFRPPDPLCGTGSSFLGTNFYHRHRRLLFHTLCALCVLWGDPFVVGSPGIWAVAAPGREAARDGWVDQTPSGFGTLGGWVPGVCPRGRSPTPGWRTESQLRTKFPDPHITDRQRSGCHHEAQEGHEKNSGIATSWKRCLPIWPACLERAFLRALHALRGLLFGAWLWIGARAARGGD
jgi:hypothetical protein